MKIFYKDNVLNKLSTRLIVELVNYLDDRNFDSICIVDTTTLIVNDLSSKDIIKVCGHTFIDEKYQNIHLLIIINHANGFCCLNINSEKY